MLILFKLYYIIAKNFKNDLSRERKQLLIYQSIFGVTFMLRVYIIIVVVEDNWVDFMRDYPDNMKGKSQTAMLPLQFMLYDFLPYMTLIFMHWQNFKPKASE